MKDGPLLSQRLRSHITIELFPFFFIVLCLFYKNYDYMKIIPEGKDMYKISTLYLFLVGGKRKSQSLAKPRPYLNFREASAVQAPIDFTGVVFCC